MTVDFLIDLFSKFIDIPIVAFLLAVTIAGIPLFVLMALNATIAVYVERKVSAFMMDRIGPMGQGPGLHAGKWGVLQTIADALKLLIKEDTVPASADKLLFKMAPFIIFIGAFLGIAALPFSSVLQVVDFNVGVFYIIAVASVGVIGIVMAGWASNNKWSLYGAMRSAAQIISYEIPAGLSIIVPIMMAGTMNLQSLIEFQTGSVWGILPNWIIFNNPFSFLAFFIFFISAVAETNRTPFDIPEAESELVAGWMTEYSGFRWAVFFLSEYANMFVVSGLAATAFLGGWQSPIPGFFNSPLWGLFWFLGKIIFLIFVMMWFRWTFPRLRVDQLMHVCWKVFIPIAMLNIFGVGIWKLIIG
ncbi:MAG: NADH-quinone oxidoreductase subunit NuoH [Candidatus Neomarinimicrobiota bacterium]|nr:NADH-quinone oxidoreductase subunit NuoH [Candidatus Neomarinimicrobiota bacterium]MEC7981061.1 NADH-quinone oxidoreductase subunit NuoH [Candidatus Neomarinimicrobiota bacterium]MEC8689374.1 NADH-quinone oxidoreductase subunit NuoH [Candidatus Neomarinimicrobiota bacterium]|tara:strand:+ start:621 stop:1697 length:1077 start_codon:yes stop_codon:yes gene_type:complete